MEQLNDPFALPAGYEISYDDVTSKFTAYYYGDPLGEFDYNGEVIEFIKRDAELR